MSKKVGVFALVKGAGIIIKEYLVRKDIKQKQLASVLFYIRQTERLTESGLSNTKRKTTLPGGLPPRSITDS